jgi:hypothetical protein
MPNMSDSKHYNIDVMCLDGVDIDELMYAVMAYHVRRPRRQPGRKSHRERGTCRQ